MVNAVLNQDNIDAGREKISELVAKFNNNKEFYTSNLFKEEEAKVEFINPMFEALGWDIHNKQGLGPNFKEVVFEESIAVGKETRAPDYSFRLGGQLIYYLEAKKPSVNIKDDRSPAFQARRYGWSAKIPIVILTDFEEFAVYETSTKPKESERASTNRVLYYTCDEYLDKWEEIYSLFSKEAVLKELFQKFVDDNTSKTKKGTQSIDVEFLKDIEKWRLILARNIALRNKDLNLAELNLAVQLIIDRIVFFRMAEDRGIERYQTLYKLSESENIYKQLCEVFKKADLKYNSGLFHFSFTPDYSEFVDNITLNLTIDDGVFKEIFADLYYPKSPYEFSVISPEILGNIYENFLGSIIRLTPSHQAKIEQKPEVKKAGGVFYTPQYIVDYIVENTVGQLIKGKTPNQISKLKILDPACGSGSFILRAYQKLLDYHLEYYIGLKKPPKEVYYVGKDNVPRLTIREKKRILTNNIFGVDIDVNAVEVTKLSLLLKVLEDENKDVLEQQQKLYQEKVLPNLSYNIKCGNSLIGTDILDQEDLDHEQILKINPFNWEHEFSLIFANGGFDVIIGNPPYVRQELIMDIKPYLKRNYVSFNGRADLYVYFFEKGAKILKEQGILSYISSNKFLKSNYGKNLRKLLLNSLNFNKYYDLTNEDVFSGVTTYPSVFVFSKQSVRNNKILIDEDYYFYQNELDDGFWSFYPKHISDLRKKIENNGEIIKNFEDISIFYGIKTGLNKAFFIDETTKNNLINEDNKNSEIIKPLVVGKNIKPWGIDYNNQYLIYTEKGININDYPSIKKYLGAFRKELTPRNNGQKIGRAKGNYEWFELQGGGSNKELLEKPKLIYPEIANKIFATYDDNGYFPNAKCFIITSETINLKYLSVILSSKLINFYFKFLATPLRGNYYNLSKIYVEKIPLILPLESEQSYFIELADKMLELNEKLINCKTPKEKKLIELQISKTDKKINRLVYELYCLTDDEIAIVEESFGK